MTSLLRWENVIMEPQELLEWPLKELMPQTQPSPKVFVEKCAPPRPVFLHSLPICTVYTVLSLLSPEHLFQFLHQLIGNEQGTECSEVSRNPLRFEVKVSQDVYCKD